MRYLLGCVGGTRHILRRRQVCALPRREIFTRLGVCESDKNMAGYICMVVRGMTEATASRSSLTDMRWIACEQTYTRLAETHFVVAHGGASCR